MRALVIEDDVLLKDFIAMCLKEHGFEVHSSTNGKSGYRRARTNNYDVLVLDINLPEMSGLEICEKVRARGVLVPILFLSASHTMDDRVRGLEAGGDDYLTKPFSHTELIARVKALARRPAGYVLPTITYAGVSVDTAKRQVHVKGQRIKLTPKEFELLELLARNAEKVLSREYLLGHIWGVTVGNTSNRLEVCVRGLRKKLHKLLETEIIKTEYGVGYTLDQSVLVENTERTE